jgi:hypothetical protein
MRLDDFSDNEHSRIRMLSRGFVGNNSVSRQSRVEGTRPDIVSIDTTRSGYLQDLFNEIWERNLWLSDSLLRGR